MDKNEIKKDETKRGLECCAAVGSETSCSDCPYRYRCKALAKDALDIITEQEKKIDALKEKCVELCDKMWDAQDDLDCYYDEMPNKVKQAKIEAVKEFAEKVKDYLEYKLVDEFGDMAVDVQYLTIDIDEFEDYVDELLREYEE